MKTLRNIIQDYLGMMPKDKECKNWSEMQTKMEEEINQFYADRSTQPRDSQGFLIEVDVDDTIEPVTPTLDQFKKDCEEWIPNDFARAMFVDRYKGLFGQPAQSWVKVEDRFPEENKTILFFNGDIGYGYYDGDTFFHPTMGPEGSVTHWMPLPSAPGTPTATPPNMISITDVLEWVDINTKVPHYDNPGPPAYVEVEPLKQFLTDKTNP